MEKEPKILSLIKLLLTAFSGIVIFLIYAYVIRYYTGSVLITAIALTVSILVTVLVGKRFKAQSIKYHGQ